jgi:hypothetical protein
LKDAVVKSITYTPRAKMRLLNDVNLLAALVIEVGAWAAIAWAAGSIGGKLWAISGGAALSAVLIAWHRWAAPNSRRRLAGFALLAFKAAVFTLGAGCLAAVGHPAAAWLLMLSAAIHLFVTERTERL